MLRKVWTVVGGLLWSSFWFAVMGMSGTLTLGLLSHRLVNVWPPVWARGLARIGGVRIRFVGAERVREPRPRILLFNHSSVLDMVVVATLNPPRVTALVKKEFVRNPLLAWAMWASGFEFVDRRDHQRAMRSMRRLERRVRARRRSVVIFPEGTRSRSGRLQPFKMGAFHLARQTGLPIVPVVIHGAWDLAPPGTLAARPGEIVVVVHDEVPTEGWTEDDVRRAARELHDAYARWLEEGPPPA